MGNQRIVASADVLRAASDAKLRDDLNETKAQVAQLTATIAKMQQQLDKAANDVFTQNFNLQKLATIFNNHTHVVNGVVGVGLSSTVDGGQQFFRYVMPPYGDEDGLAARRTGGPVQPKN